MPFLAAVSPWCCCRCLQYLELEQRVEVLNARFAVSCRGGCSGAECTVIRSAQPVAEVFEVGT